jgi:membrane protease subunit HflC
MSISIRLPIYGMLALVAIATFFSCFFIVDPSERAGVRFLGTVTSEKPLQPGLHFKVPLLSTADRIQVSLTNVHIKSFEVNTVDNQRVSLEVNISYVIPDAAVFHIMYNVGRSGPTDIRENIEPIVRDRVSRIFASKNTNYISAQREEIQNEILKSVHEAMNELFKVDVKSLQIASIGYSDAFKASNDQAVLAKNLAIQEENKKKVIEYQAQQKVITAEGQAREQVALAEGQNRATILAAEAKARAVELEATAHANAAVISAKAQREALELQGKGESIKLEALVKAAGSASSYISLIQAESQKKWNGSVPQFMVSDKTPVMMPFMQQAK